MDMTFLPSRLGAGQGLASRRRKRTPPSGHLRGRKGPGDRRVLQTPVHQAGSGEGTSTFPGSPATWRRLWGRQGDREASSPGRALGRGHEGPVCHTAQGTAERRGARELGSGQHRAEARVRRASAHRPLEAVPHLRLHSCWALVPGHGDGAMATLMLLPEAGAIPELG